jgi:hypothetical protein
VKRGPGEELDTKSRTPAPPEPQGPQQLVRQKTHHHRDGAAFNTDIHAIDNSHVHDISTPEKAMSQSNSDPDPESTDKREEERKIKHFSLDKRGDCIDNFMTYNVSGFKHKPSYEEILQQEDNCNEQLETTAMMVQSATNKGSNTTEENSSSSAVKAQPATNEGSNTTKEGSSSSAVKALPRRIPGTFVQQVASGVGAHLRHSGVSDAMMPRLMDTILPSHADNHVIDFMHEDIPPATTDPIDHHTCLDKFMGAKSIHRRGVEHPTQQQHRHRY